MDAQDFERLEQFARVPLSAKIISGIVGVLCGIGFVEGTLLIYRLF